jgi:hypothetical protein
VGQKVYSEIVVGVTRSQKVAFEHQNDELKRLGIHLKECSFLDWDQKSVDICIIPSEIVQSSFYLTPDEEKADTPFIISLTSESPAIITVEDAIQKAVGFMYGHPSVYQFALELELGMHLHRERKFNRRRVEHAATKIQNNRTIGVATGLLMAKTDMNSLDVFDSLKVFSRNNQVRISTIAENIISIHEQKQLHVKEWIEDLGNWLTEKVDVEKALMSRKKASGI